MYKDLIFDLYGTLVDIHTEEDDLVWEKTALYFGYYGAHYTPEELKAAFDAQLRQRQAKAGQSYECFPDIPFEDVMAAMFLEKGVIAEDGPPEEIIYSLQGRRRKPEPVRTFLDCLRRELERHPEIEVY